jgi:hypothetical protein
MKTVKTIEVCLGISQHWVFCVLLCEVCFLLKKNPQNKLEPNFSIGRWGEKRVWRFYKPNYCNGWLNGRKNRHKNHTINTLQRLWLNSRKGNVAKWHFSCSEHWVLLKKRSILSTIIKKHTIFSLKILLGTKFRKIILHSIFDKRIKSVM